MAAFQAAIFFLMQNIPTLIFIKREYMVQGKIMLIAFCAALLASSCKEHTIQEPAGEHKNVHYDPGTPTEALTLLKEGNKRFLENKMINTDYRDRIEATIEDQYPHSVILSCMDSRIPPEIIFDQGIGNIFVTRIAGNIEDADILGSMEYAVKVKHVDLILVMGHQDCAAVKGSIDNVQLGNLTQLLDHIKPAIKGDTANKKQMVEETVRNNIRLTMEHILQKSEVIREMVKENKVKIAGAYYHLGTGEVEFIE